LCIPHSGSHRKAKCAWVLTRAINFREKPPPNRLPPPPPHIRKPRKVVPCERRLTARSRNFRTPRQTGAFRCSRTVFGVREQRANNGRTTSEHRTNTVRTTSEHRTNRPEQRANNERTTSEQRANTVRTRTRTTEHAHLNSTVA
jgi:hypothetical protein